MQAALQIARAAVHTETVGRDLCVPPRLLGEVSPSCLLIAFNSCMVLSPTMTIALRILDATRVHALCGCAVWDRGYAYF